jgi:hypothetical protein
MGFIGIASFARGQRRHHNGGVALPHAQQVPTGFLLAAIRLSMGCEFAEQRS